MRKAVLLETEFIRNEIEFEGFKRLPGGGSGLRVPAHEFEVLADLGVDVNLNAF